MRTKIFLALFVFLALGLRVSEARVKLSCPEFGRPCECAWHVRDCVPICHVGPRVDCVPT